MDSEQCINPFCKCLISEFLIFHGIDFQNKIRCFWKKRWGKSSISCHVNERYWCLFTISSMAISQMYSIRKVHPGNGSGEKWVHEICQGNGLRKKISPGNESRKCQGNGLGKKWVQEMSPGTGSRKWVQEMGPGKNFLHRQFLHWRN